jgi:hypothetical protein
MESIKGRLEIILVFGCYVGLNYSVPIEKDVTSSPVNTLSRPSVAKVAALNDTYLGTSGYGYFNLAND